MFGEKQEEINSLRAEVERLSGRLALAETVGRTAESVGAQIQEYLDSGQALDVATGMAEAVVLSTERDKLTQDLRDELVRTHGTEIAATYRHEQGPQRRQVLDAQFKQDGTYAKVAAETRRALDEEARQKLIKDEQAKILAELSTPQAREAVLEILRAELLDSKELTAFRDATHRKLRETWTDEARESTRQHVTDEENAREAEYKREAASRYLESGEGKAFRRDLAERLERKWKQESVKAIQAELGDKVLAELLAERAVQEAKKLADENKAQELLVQFEGVGIDVNAIERGAIVALYLGIIKEEGPYSSAYSDPYSSQYGQRPAGPTATLECERKLTLVALGDGRLKVRADSLGDSKSTWEKSLALEEGTVIVVGNVVRDNGTATLESRIAADVNLYYDSDPATPATFSEMPVPLANVIIGDVSARKVDEVKGAGTKQPKKS